MGITATTSRTRHVLGRAGIALALVAALFVAPTGPASGATEGAGFTDIRTSPHAGFIEAVAAAGITGGCAADLYCPQRHVTRGQMATFLMKALDLPAGPLFFLDVPLNHAHAKGIGAVAAAGITSGYSDGTFRPGDRVSRGQMATFLAKGLDLPPAAVTFSDVPASHPHAKGIAAVAAAKISTGCAGGGYCPNDPVTRAQMASFLGRGLGLDPIVIDYPEPEPPVGPDAGPTALPSQFIRGHSLVHEYSLKTDVWKVWICNVPTTSPNDQRQNLDPSTTTAQVRNQFGPYFTWLSEGRYTPRFEVGGAFTLVNAEKISVLEACRREAMDKSSGAMGALSILNVPLGEGLGSVGFICGPEPCPTPTTLPESNRGAVVGGLGVQAYPDGGIFFEPQPSIIAHEIGHALGFPHSYTRDPSVESWNQYTDPTDIMSGAHKLVGTIAANRFAAGWLGDKAKLHAGGTRDYTIGSVGYSGTQMVLVPSSTDLAFTTIGAIAARDYNVNFWEKIEGVTLHRVDQRPDNCIQHWWMVDCRHTNRRHAPIGPPHKTEHVLQVGQSKNIGGVTVTVLEKIGDGWRVRVSGDRSDFAPLGR